MKLQGSLPVLFFLALPAASAAQQATTVPPSIRRGMLSAVPVGIIASPDGGTQDLLVIDPGTQEGAPQPWSAARFGHAGENYPDFSMAALFGPLASVIELTGVSTGNDLMPETSPDGTLIMNNQWFTLTVSVTNDALGQGNSHVDRIALGQGDSPGSELFTYYALGSVGIDPVLVNTNHSERSREELGLAAPQVPPMEKPDVSALDFGIGMIAFDPIERSVDLFPTRDRFYFAVAQACAPLLGPSFAVDPELPPGSNTVAANAATIYACEWRLSAGSWSWSQPSVYRSPAVLGLDPAFDQIDALGVSTPQDAVIFSTQLVPGRNQLQVLQPTQSAPKALKAQNGMTITQHLGLTEDTDVDGTCGIDPVVALCGGRTVSIPTTPVGETPLGISVVRGQPGFKGADSIHVQVTGLDLAHPDDILLLYVGLAPSLPPGLGQTGWSVFDVDTIAPGQSQATWTYPAASLGCNTAIAVQLLSSAPDYLSAVDPLHEPGFGQLDPGATSYWSSVSILDLRN